MFGNVTALARDMSVLHCRMSGYGGGMSSMYGGGMSGMGGYGGMGGGMGGRYLNPTP